MRDYKLISVRDSLFIWGLMRAVVNSGGIVAGKLISRRTLLRISVLKAVIVLRRALWKPISNQIGRNMDVLSCRRLGRFHIW